MILRPAGIVLEGTLEFGLELVVDDAGVIAEIRPHTGLPELTVLSPGFANAHSHLEYRGLQGAIAEREYWPWIRTITQAKTRQEPDEVRRDAALAAQENLATGVRRILEHSDRPVAGPAMREAGLGGVIYQELITFLEQADPVEKLALVRERAAENATAGYEVHWAPHAAYTVDEGTLSTFSSGSPFSMHVAETPLETQFFRFGTGPIADLYASVGVPARTTGETVVEYLARLGLVRSGAQYIHVCAIDDADLVRLAEGGVEVVHCPRSNRRLGCPIAPVRRMLEAGMAVGLGLDSPASSGPIDMFDEMRAALLSSRELGEPLRAEVVWRMATGSLETSRRIEDWIEIDLAGATNTEDLLERLSPERVRSPRFRGVFSSSPGG